MKACRSRRAAVLALGLLLPVVLAQPAEAAAQVSRAELDGSRLRIEGTALANRAITVDGVQMGTSDGSGRFRIQTSGYTPPADCTVDVNDGTATAASARLTGCSVTTAPSPAATLASISVSPTSVQGGGSATATVTLSAAAPTGGAVVALSSSVPSVASVPASVTVPVGASSVTGSVSTSAVTATSAPVLSASYAGLTVTTTLSVTPPALSPLVITNQSDQLVDGEVGQPYEAALFADGGVPPYTWSHDAGTLPPGLTVQVTPGHVHGTPTTAGTYVFTLRVTDSTGAPATRQFSLSVAAPPAVTNTISPDVAEFAANVGTPFFETFVFGPEVTSPSTFQLESGALPDGLALTEIPDLSDRNFPENAIRIQGTPTTEQASTFTLRATDAVGLTATRTYTIRVAAPRPLTITPQECMDPSCPLLVGTSRNMFLDGDGGVLPYTWSISAGALPPGLSVIQDSDTVGLVRIGGTATTAGDYSFTLRLTDALSASVDRAFSVTVLPAVLPTLEEVAVTPTVVGGTSPIATVRLTPGAPLGGAEVALSSSHPQVASVPASVTVPAGDTIGAFPVTTSTVAESTTTTITATYAGVTRTTTLTVTPPVTSPPPEPSTDSVSVSRAEYDSDKRRLRVEASSSASGVTLRVYVTATDTLIGTLSGGGGEFSVSTHPQSITVRSSGGGSATRQVAVK